MQDLQSYAESRSRMGGEYDISAFIIPPPPTSDEKDNRSSDIIRRLYEAKEGISKVCYGYKAVAILLAYMYIIFEVHIVSLFKTKYF